MAETFLPVSKHVAHSCKHSCYLYLIKRLLNTHRPRKHGVKGSVDPYFLQRGSRNVNVLMCLENTGTPLSVKCLFTKQTVWRNVTISNAAIKYFLINDISNYIVVVTQLIKVTR